MLLEMGATKQNNTTTKHMRIDYEVIKPAIKIAKESPDQFKMVAELALKSRVLKESFGVIYKDKPNIETLPKEEKTDIWSFVCEMWPNKSKEDKIILSKTVYVIGLLF